MKTLKKLRKERNISQKDLAKALSISRESISKYEMGEQEPSFLTLKKISKFFDVSIDYLLENENYNYISITKKDINDLYSCLKKIEKIIQKLSISDDIDD